MTDGFSLIIGHMAGDFLLQNDWMAQGKKRSSLVCGVHCLVYTVAVASFIDWQWPLWAFAVVFATHFIQDRTSIVPWWMRKHGQSKFCEPPMAPWSFVVVDNTFHLLVLWCLRRAIA